MEAFVKSNSLDLVCLSETFLDLTLPNKQIKHTNKQVLITKSWSSKWYQTWRCIYFKESLPLIRRNDLTNMKDCIVTEINVNNKKCFFTCLYRSPSQSHEELERFCANFDLMQNSQNGVLLTEIIQWVLN